MLLRFVGYILAVAAVFLWSMNYIYAKLLLNFTPMQISFIRWFLAMIFFLPFTLKSLWVYRRLLWQNLEYIIIMGLSGLALVNICVYYAGHTANAVDMSLIATLGPLLIIVLNSLLQRKIPPFRVVAGIILAFAGVLAVILHGDFENLRNFDFVAGDIWMLGTAFMFAVYSLCQRRLPPKLPALTSLSAAIIVAVLFCTPDFLLQQDIDPMPMPDKKETLILLVIGFLNSGLAYLWWNVAIKRIGLVHTGIIYYLLPVFGCIMAHYVLDETLYSSQIYGAMLVVAGIILAAIPLKKRFLPSEK